MGLGGLEEISEFGGRGNCARRVSHDGVDPLSGAQEVDVLFHNRFKATFGVEDLLEVPHDSGGLHAELLANVLQAVVAGGGEFEQFQPFSQPGFELPGPFLVVPEQPFVHPERPLVLGQVTRFLDMP